MKNQARRKQFANENTEKAFGRNDTRAYAFNSGKAIAKSWIRSASPQEIKDVMRRSNARHDTNYFVFMRTIFFRSLMDAFPAEAKRYQSTDNDSFMNGWREGVISLCKSNSAEVSGD